MSKGFVVAGPASGSGKTTVALGLMAALARRGLAVQPFKCGPDFIDPGHHTRVCGAARASRNLDGWMLPAAVNRAIFTRHAATADVCVVEGVMGLFDGARRSSPPSSPSTSSSLPTASSPEAAAAPSPDAGSTADIARMLGLPIILVVDAAKMAGSAAAVVHGFATFDPSVRVAGVIFNQVGSVNHYALLRDAMTRVHDVAPLGYLPRDAQLRLPERYLGLVTAGDEALTDEAIAHLAALVERHVDVNRLLDLSTLVERPVDVDRLLALAATANADVSERRPVDAAIRGDASPAQPCLAAGAAPAKALSRLAPPAAPAARIGVARDRAFCFYYEDNFDALRAAGAKLVTFSPLHDAQLPADLDALYFGGGYPELWAETLSANHAMRAAVLRFIGDGGHVYAECGGLMYLSETIATRDGRCWPMVAALPLAVAMTDRSQRFGYVELTLARDTLLGPAGTTARGHSFHYSRLEGAIDGGIDAVPRAYQLHYTLSGRDEAEGFAAGRVLASYVHVHFLSNPAIAAEFVRRIAGRIAGPLRNSGAPRAETVATPGT
jgi:cobyrinic acid a,c-diamide synthase